MAEILLTCGGMVCGIMIGLAKVVIDLSSRNGTGRQQYHGLVRGRYRSRKVAGRSLDRSRPE